ncbi:MAG: hypothetical protein WD359_02960 [Dehalococcoidia bacterium]
MPPMSTLRTFITALSTGETRTTKALEGAARRRRGAAADELLAALRRRGALNAPLKDPIRQVIRKAPLPDRYIDGCIDAWPDAQKERARRAVVKAMRDGKRLRFRWGLTAGRGYETEIRTVGSLTTITALSPRHTLHIGGGEVHVAPARFPRKR